MDLRFLNSVTKFDSYPLHVIEEITSTLYGSKYYSVIDYIQGSWQIKIRDHKERTGFTVPSGHYEFNKLPFGLSNSPSSFQRLKDIVLKNLVGIYCYVYLDDVAIFSQTVQEHAQRLESIHRFNRANLQLKPEKCVITQPQGNYLGYVLSEKGVSASPDKVKAVRDYPTPKSVKNKLLVIDT
jgi:hypothetical protein